MNSLGYLAAAQTLAQDVNKATDSVAEALAAVKQLSKDVEAGVAPSSDLERAMKDLQAKIERTKVLSNAAKGLDGFGEQKSINPLWVLIGLGAIYVFFIRPK